jgi:transcriptional regulator with XRE-family HTH domain
MRKHMGLRAIDVCCGTKLHPVTISAIENRRLVPGAKTRVKICEFLGISEAEAFDSNGLAV